MGKRKREIGKFNVPWWMGKDSCLFVVIGSDKITHV